MAPATVDRQTPLSGELLVTCPLCKSRVRLEPADNDVLITFFPEREGPVMRTEALFSALHACEHVHHYVPQATGEKIGGQRAYILVCACGLHQGEVG